MKPADIPDLTTWIDRDPDTGELRDRLLSETGTPSAVVLSDDPQPDHVITPR